ncbi:MAG: hypothetical protein HN564_07685 [Flavobacteriales bacterium]|jgi:hypothetical protein|nr:hypothetical protein [Flavobacteriales bacterium]
MSKTYIIISFFLLLVSCSDYKVKKAIENCADQKFNNSNSVFINLPLYEMPQIRKIDKKIYSLKKLLKSKELLIKQAHDKYMENNPSPRWKPLDLEYPKIGSPNYNENYRIYQKKKLEHNNKHHKESINHMKALQSFLTPFSEEIKEVEKKIRTQKWELKKAKLFIIKEEFNKMSFKEKSKVIDYVNLYGSCEQEYKDLPNKFLIQYD